MKERINTIRGAFKVLDALLTVEEKEHFRRQSADEFAYEQHFGLGMWIRNTWIYNADKATYKALFGDEILHPDTASYNFLLKYHDHLKRKK